MTKKYIILLFASLLSLSAFAYQYEGTMMIQLNNNPDYPVPCIFETDNNTVTIGNGYNACIPHYEEGEVTIPGTFTREATTYKVIVGPFAFRFCTGLTKVTIGEGSEHIGDCAFVGCSGLTNVVLPSTMQTIGSGAFSELPSLKVVKCLATTAPAWQWNDVFAALGTKKSMEQMAATRILYVPANSTDSYLSTKFDGTSSGTQTTANENVGWQEAFNRIYELIDEPQTIGSLAELMEFRDAVNGDAQYKNSANNSVVLTADIDLSTVDDWTPIGTAEKPFNGVFDGGGHVISNLKVNRPEGENVGLFGYAKNATIYNLHLLNPSVKGSNYVGCLLGTAYEDMRISDVLVTGSGSAADYYTVSGSLCVGGIVGFANKMATIERCMFSGAIKGTLLSCGGIIGEALLDVTVSDCSSSYLIESKDAVSKIGGIVGIAMRATIERCFVRNTLTGSSELELKLGYLIGEVHCQDQSTEYNNYITNCAYWQTSTDISTVGQMNTNEYATLTESGNQAYTTEDAMLGDATKAQLGDNWTFFTGKYSDYPVPATLKDMYLKQVLPVDANGLVFSPVGSAASPSAYEVCAYDGSATTLTIPDTYNDKPVTAILPEVFRGNSTLQTITIGSHVTDIGESAFEDCDALTAVTLPDAVTYVHARAFRGCDNLTTFTIGTGFASHDDNFIVGCPKLTTLQMSGDNANGYVCLDNVLIHNISSWFSYFIACAPGKTGDYTIPLFGNIENIEIFPDCFSGCTGLTSITFPSTRRYAVGKGAFNGATNLRYIDMSNVLGTIEREKPNDGYISLTADRHDPDSPFYGISQSTMVYLQGDKGHTAAAGEPNIVIGGTANSILLTDGWDFNPPMDITATNGISYNRLLEAMPVDTEKGYKFQRNGYSVCLPYDLTLSATNAKVYTPNAVATVEGTTTVTFTEVANKAMTAYTPYYIIVDGDGDVSLDAPGPVTISRPAALPTTALTGFTFKGTMVTIPNASLYDASQPTYILQSDGNWHRVPYDDDNVYAGPLRAYFQASADNGAAQLVTVFDETVSLADNADNTDILAQYNGSRVNAVQLAGRTLYKDGSWNTLCLPFDLTISGSPLAGDNVTAKVLDTASSSLDNGTLTLNFIEAPTTITAGTPFIIKWDNTGVNLVGDNLVFSGVTVKNTVDNASVEDVIDFVATYSPVSLDAGDNDKLYLGAGNTLYYPSTDMTINSCRAYFQLKGGFVAGSAAARIVLNFGDDEQTQGVTTPLSDRSEAAGEVLWYTLDGRRLSTKPAKKGIYLNNGHKVVVE
jgi:hypothetical protein